MWFEYDQNNSGGRFVVNDKLCHRIFIEADSESEANDIAESLGIYFDGCDPDVDRDCPCCGDRWTRPYRATEFPFVYGTFPEAKAKELAEKYKVECRPAVKKAYSAFKDHTHEVVFPCIEVYARFMADDFGWTSPDVRIYYKAGHVLTINSAAVDKEIAERKKKRK